MHSPHRSHTNVVEEFSKEAQLCAATDRKIAKLNYDLQLVLKPYQDQKEIVAKKVSKVKALNEEVAEFKNMCNSLEGDKLKAKIRHIIKTTARQTLAEAKALSRKSHEEIHVMNEKQQNVKDIEEQIRTRMKEIEHIIEGSDDDEMEFSGEFMSADVDAFLDPLNLAEQLQGNQQRPNSLNLEGDTVKMEEAKNVVIALEVPEIIQESVAKNFESTCIIENSEDSIGKLSACVVPVSDDSSGELELKKVLTDAETNDSAMFSRSQGSIRSSQINVRQKESLGSIRSFRITPKQNESPISPKQNKSPITPKQNDSPINPKQNDSPITPKQNESPTTLKQNESASDEELETMISIRLLNFEAEKENRSYQKERESNENIDASKFDKDKIINQTELRLEYMSGTIETVELEMIQVQKNLTKAEDEKKRCNREIDILKKHLKDLYFEKFLFTEDLQKAKDSPDNKQNWLKLKSELESRPKTLLKVSSLA